MNTTNLAKWGGLIALVVTAINQVLPLFTTYLPAPVYSAVLTAVTLAGYVVHQVTDAQAPAAAATAPTPTQTQGGQK